MLFQNAALACKRVSRMHLIPISASRDRNMSRTKSDGNGEEGEMTSTWRLPWVSQQWESCQIEPNELNEPASTHSDDYRKEIPQLP